MEMDLDLEDAEQFLVDLHAAIWKKDRISYLHPGHCPLPGRRFVNPNKIRDLTSDEAKLVFVLARKHNFPATIIPSFGGLSFNLKIYSNNGLAICRLISIESTHFPGNQGKARDKTTYSLVARFVYTKRNQELIKTHKVEKPARYTQCVL